MSRVSISKTVKAVKGAGLSVVGVEIAPDGTVRVLTATANESAHDDLEAMREARRARKAERLAQSH